MIAVQHLAEDLLSLLFPVLCNGCGTNLAYGEKHICTSCLFDLPYTDFHLYNDNPVAKQFWGRVNCEAITAMLYFRKGTKVQQLIHGLKYKGQTALGLTLGTMLGDKLNDSKRFDDIDLIIPVPLHPRKIRLRGYNQSEYLANGVAEVLNCPVSTKNLLRDRLTSSQTKKSRYTRYENMRTVFSVHDAHELKNLHILIVDDVITTGATLEACCDALLNVGVKKISIAAIAFAK